MEPRVVDNPDQRRFEICVGAELAGWTSYDELGPAYVFTHTEIDERFSGRGLGSTLISRALDAMREQGRPVVPLCPFVRRFIATHEAYRDLVPDQLGDALDRPADGAQTS